MLGSQAIEYSGSVAGYELGLPEIERFGHAAFPTAVATSDDWNSHSGIEVVYLLHGEACWEMKETVLLRVNGGQSVVFPAGTKHRITNGIYPPSKCFWMVLNQTRAEEAPETGQPVLTSESRTSFQEALGRYHLTRNMSESCLLSVNEAVRLMKDKHVFTGSKIHIAELRAHLHMIMVETWKTHAREKRQRANSALVGEVLKILHHEPNETLSVNEIADQMNCSRGYLHKSFSREVGMSPSDYLQRLKIRRACNHLRLEDSTITDVALGAGFGSSQHFAKVFRKYMGLTPTQYREQLSRRIYTA